MIKILGITIFDLENVCEISKIKFYREDNEYGFSVEILRGRDTGYSHFNAKTQAEADSARAELEAAVMKARGIA